MNNSAQKLELIQWISGLNDNKILKKVTEIQKFTKRTEKKANRYFGCGKDIIGYISDDFNEPLEMFGGYKP